MADESDEDEQDQTLTNFLFGNVDAKGRLEGADYIPEVRCSRARIAGHSTCVSGLCGVPPSCQLCRMHGTT